MGNKNTSSTTNEGLKEIDKQTNPVMYGWRCQKEREGRW